MKGECKSIVSAIKAFLNDVPCALWYHNANEDQMRMFGGSHFHVVAYTTMPQQESFRKLQQTV